MRYKLIDHTADFGIRVFGKDAKELFQNAALTMFELIVESGTPRVAVEKKVSVSGADRPDLMVNWLRELLFSWAGRQEILCGAIVDELTANSLSARIKMAVYNPDRDSVLNEIKAVTYHQINVSEIEDHWEARIIFDV